MPSGFDRGYEYRTDFAFYDTSCGLRIDIEVDGAFKEHDDDIQKKCADGMTGSYPKVGMFFDSMLVTAIMHPQPA